jgi:hypothetical protein
MADIVHVIRFTRMVAPYMSGEEAGFPPEIADHYLKHGYAVLVAASQAAVSPDVAAMDAKRRVDELRALLGHAEAEAAGATALAKRLRAGGA